MLKNTDAQYGSVAKFFHWVVFLLVAALLLVGYFMGDISDKATKIQVVNVHKLVGLSVLILMLLRMTWSMTNRKPSLPFGTPQWQKRIERIVHYLLYLLIIAMPLSGWVMSCAAGHVPQLGSWVFSLPVPKNEALSDFSFQVHSWLAIAIIALVSLHILAAFYHFLIKKDDIFQRML